VNEKRVRFLADEEVHRVGEKPMVYKAGEVYALRLDRAQLRIQNGTAVEVPEEKADGNAVESSADLGGKDGGDTGKRAVDEPASGRKRKSG
jgi:hypothetical protein